MNFWTKLAKPIIGLSPMDGVSDVAFRYIMGKYGRPSVIITEFISTDGILKGAESLFTDFLYHEIERPIVAQIFGNEPELFYQSAIVACELGFDGIDINMGCPAKSVANRGAGAGLIRFPKLAQEIITSTKNGVQEWYDNGTKSLPEKVIKKIKSTKAKLNELEPRKQIIKKLIPVSVKTRIGFDQEVVDIWIPQLLEVTPANISLHGRTLKQMYQGKADWEAIQKAANIVAQYNKTSNTEPITFLGNGDIIDKSSLNQRISMLNVDGVLIGRGSFGNPWIFAQENTNIHDDIRKYFDIITPIIHKHVTLHLQTKSEKAFPQLYKHLGWYFSGFPNASALRSSLMKCKNLNEIDDTINNFKANL
jgi:tRNA-dihydrouridine synthase B